MEHTAVAEIPFVVNKRSLVDIESSANDLAEWKNEETAVDLLFSSSHEPFRLKESSMMMVKYVKIIYTSLF